MLNRPVLDAEGGYMLAPMRRHPPHHGRRIRPPRCPADAGPARAGPPRARNLSRWASGRTATLAGARPCLPDMLPIVGPAPRHRGLWFDFGHHHLGFTLARSRAGCWPR